MSDTVTLLQEAAGRTYVEPKRRLLKTRPHPLSDIPDLRIQQGLIVKDVLFALLGYEGGYVRYSEKYDPLVVDACIAGPDYKIAKHLDISLKTITKRLVRYGKQYSGLVGFVNYYNNQQYGKVVQRLCFNINKFLETYHRLVIALESEFSHNTNFSLNTLETSCTAVSNHLAHLYDIVTEIHITDIDRKQRANQSKGAQFHDFILNVKHTLEHRGVVDTSVSGGNFEACKGGLVLKIIQNRINAYKGDLASSEFLLSLFDSVSEDYVAMLNSWLIDGEIHDQFDEFLVREKLVPQNFIEMFNSRSEHYWNELFVVRSDGLIDQFASIDTQLKILNTGKYLNVFKSSTGLHNFQNLNETIEPISKIFSHDLELKIDELHNRANKLLLKLLFEGYNIPAVIGNYQSLFLFNDSFKIDKFLDKLFNDLKRNRYAISLSRLQKQYNDVYQNQQEFELSRFQPRSSIPQILNQSQKFTITATNFYEVAKEIMNVQSFDTEALENDNFQTFLNKTLDRGSSANTNQPGPYDQNHLDEYAIASVDLSIELPFPLNLIINRELSYHYELMFKLQVVIKFISKFSDNTWKEINNSAVWKYRFEPRVCKWILRARTLHKRMRDFVNELQAFINYDVVESNYSRLREYLEETGTKLQGEKMGSDVKGAGTSFSNYNTSNNLFDSKISSSRTQNSKKDELGVATLMSYLNEYLNSLINDSLITKPDLLNVLKSMFDVLILYNHYLSRLKKMLILCNEDLFESFSRDYPDKFGDSSMDRALVDGRILRLDETLKVHFEAFGESLTQFIVTVKGYGETDNKKILVLSERLERSFPL